MPTLTETEDRLRRALEAVASSVNDSGQPSDQAAAASEPSATQLAPGGLSGLRRRSPLLVFVASFLAVLAVGAISVLTMQTESDLEVGGPAGQAPISDPASGLGMDSTYFAFDDPSWTLTVAYTESDSSTYSRYERDDERVDIATGSFASEILDQRPERPETILTMNASQVTERSFFETGNSSEESSFNWTTSDGLPVLVTFLQMNPQQGLEASAALRPIDSEAWQQLAATAVHTTTPESELRARTGEFGTGGEEGFGEWIRLDAPDAPQVILEMSEGIELPPGQTFDRWIENLPDEPTSQTEDGIMSSLEFHAGCIWTGYWLEAVANKDTTAQAQAQAILDDIPTWPAMNASDGGGVIDAWRRNAELAAAGDVQGVLDNLYTNNCTDLRGMQ